MVYNKNAYGGYMRIASLDDYLAHERHTREWVEQNRPPAELALHDQRQMEAQERRARAVALFPHTLVCEGSYPEHDVAQRWCWRQFGPVRVEKCYDQHSEYPGCPLVLETKVLATGGNKDGSRWAEWRYKDPGEHSHEGTWTTIWHGKTGYDYGFAEYCFQHEGDRDAFGEIVEKLGMGELYEDDLTKPGCEPSMVPQCESTRPI